MSNESKKTLLLDYNYRIVASPCEVPDQPAIVYLGNFIWKVWLQLSQLTTAAAYIIWNDLNEHERNIEMSLKKTRRAEKS